MKVRSFFCLLLACLLLLGASASGEEGSSWADAHLPYERDPLPVEIVPWDELPPVVEGQHHYLLLCIDQWEKKARPADAEKPTGPNGERRDMYGNTDGIVLVTLDTRAHRVMLTSVIREALVQRPDGGIGRINYIYNDYGPEALCRTISEHIGVRVEKYILFNFKQIENIVNYLGGVDVDLNYSEINYLRRYAVPWGSVTSLAGRDLRASGSHPEGTYHFKGHSAVLYMRIRKAGGGGDFMRTQRVRNVLSKLADKCREITWDDAKALANNVMENNNLTNLNLEEMMDAASYAFSLRDCTIEELRLPPDSAARAIKYANMTTQEIDWAACRASMEYYLQNSFLVMDDEE